MNWEKILYWALVIFMIYIIIEIIKNILGGSLGIAELTLALVGLNITFSFYMNAKLSHHIGWHKGKDCR